uniref:Uncharacterized protein n=1 Tax=Anguilla anguilla TaxID=7936 RepID=A0A0E9WP58_ANGAN
MEQMNSMVFVIGPMLARKKRNSKKNLMKGTSNSSVMNHNKKACGVICLVF